MSQFRLLPAVLPVLAAFLIPAVTHAANPDRCRAYADSQVDFANRADPKACPRFKGRANNWDGHFNWCLKTPLARVDSEDDTWGAIFDGCMSAIEAGKTERALAAADSKARVDGATGSYDERWRKGVQRMADIGMTLPSHPKGFEFRVVSTESKVWSSGTVQGQQIGYYGVCDTCQGITARLKDARGKVIAERQSTTNAIELMAVPQVAGKGSIEIIVTNCQTRDDSCKMRISSFAP